MNRIISLVSFSMFLIIFAMFSCKTDQKSNLDSSSKDERFNEPTSKLAKDSALLSAKKQQEIFVPLALNKVSETQWVCAGQIPNGWVKINDSWNPTTCGNPTSISYNVWLIERYDDKPIGSVMTICSQSIPNGWVKIGGSWNPTMCGNPTSISENVIQIKRLN